MRSAISIYLAEFCISTSYHYLHPQISKAYMKFRVFLLLAVAFAGVISMSSCVKEYTCQCVIKYSGVPGLPDSVVNEYSIQDTKSGAEQKCKDESGTYNTNGVQTVEACKLY
jgi:hypothetical protein